MSSYKRCLNKASGITPNVYNKEQIKKYFQSISYDIFWAAQKISYKTFYL